mgnify:FL=1
MSTCFYRALEDRFRGSREVIKTRLEVYQPFIRPLKLFYSDAQILDLGCGRGEWLELVTQMGFRAKGVDIDEHMLDASRALGLDVQAADAIDFLKKLSCASQVVISAFHLVEHLAFSDLHTIVQESLRVLRPGGLLIMETPNPENIVVGTVDFYLDPTHHHPLPPDLLAFLPEFYGFEKIKIMRLQESNQLIDNQTISLFNVLGGVSPDYAVVARKEGPAALLDRMNPVFDVSYGVSLKQLATIYSQQKELFSQPDKEMHLSHDCNGLGDEIEKEICDKTNNENISMKKISLQLSIKLSEGNLKIKELTKVISGLQSELEGVYNSSIWRFTGPLRSALNYIRKKDLFLKVKGLMNRFQRLSRIRLIGGLYYKEKISLETTNEVDLGSVETLSVSPRIRKLYSQLKKN